MSTKSTRYLGTTSFPGQVSEVLPNCIVPVTAKGAIESTLWCLSLPTLLCGLSSLKLGASRLLVGAERMMCAPSLDTVSARIERSIQRCKNQRHLFLNDALLNRFPMKKSHSHAAAASFRSAMNAFMCNVASEAGFDPYLVSMSAMDHNDGRRGTRQFHGMKDLGVPYKNDKVKKNDVLIMVDVDYYADMNRWLKYNRPILLYTMIPTSLSRKPLDEESTEPEFDYAYRFIDGEVEYSVAGGSSYRHQLWDYGVEKVCTYNFDNTLSTFLVEQRMIPGDPDHRYVVITPEARVAMPACVHLEEFVEPFKRFNPAQGKLNVMYDPITDEMSLARDGSWHCVSIAGRTFETIKKRVLAKGTGVVCADVERMLLANKHKGVAAADAPLLCEMIEANVVANVVSTNGAINYQPIGKLVTEDGKPAGASGTTPLVLGAAVIPNNSHSTDLAAVNGRVLKQKNDVTPPPFVKGYANEFVQRVVPERLAGIGVPLSVQQVRDRQTKPAQQARYATVASALSIEDENRLKTFVKVEGYASINDPRMITTVDAGLTTLLSGFTLAMKDDVLKEHAWFGAGLTPDKQIARVRDLALRGKDWLVTDFSRLDGTVSEFLQMFIVKAAYMRWANANHRVDFKNEFMKVFVKRARTKNGVGYDAGWGTRSGSPQTTDGNTMICAFVVYVAYRLLDYTPTEAWAKLGLLYGDDGVHSDDEGLAEALEKAAMLLGLKLKCESIKRGEPVPYLGRFFVDPVVSDDTFQDPMRTIGKLHLTANVNVPASVAMSNKALGYRVTDAKTPIIGAWCEAVLSITGAHDLQKATSEEIHKCNNSWPQSDKYAIAEAMAKVMGMDVKEIWAMDTRVAKVAALNAFPVLFEIQREVKLDAVYDGEIVYAKTDSAPFIQDGEPTEHQPAAIVEEQGEVVNDSNRCCAVDHVKPGNKSDRVCAEGGQNPHARRRPDGANHTRSARGQARSQVGDERGDRGDRRIPRFDDQATRTIKPGKPPRRDDRGPAPPATTSREGGHPRRGNRGGGRSHTGNAGITAGRARHEDRGSTRKR
jgi:hypothetical protein